MDILRKIPKTVPVALIFTLFIGSILILLSPEDKELGAILKLIYLHGALVTSGLSLFTAAGLVSLISLFRSGMKFKLSLVSVGIYFISTSIDDHKIISLLGIGLALSVWALMGSAGNILHPDNPFGASEPSIRTFFFLITLVFLAASVLTVRWMKKQK
jgi:hypothetical protein